MSVIPDKMKKISAIDYRKAGHRILINAFLLLAIACSTPKPEQDKEDISQEEGLETRIGGFLSNTAFNAEGVDLAYRSVIITAFSEPGFPRQMTTLGTKFAIMPDVTDQFVEEVATTYHQMFPQDSTMDLTTQQAVLDSMVQYNSLIPVLAGRYENMSEDVEAGFESMQASYSICDIIMYRDGTGRQTMEVVEHLLHYVTSIGLHLAIPSEWSFTDPNSEITKVMNEAVQKGLYQIESYEDIKEESEEAYQRVLVQEFAYWLITTYWDLQEPYGPLEEEEWNIDNKVELLEKLPSGFELVQKSIDPFMVSPDIETLELFRKYN